ncbi:ABC transporter substrate-binding protein [Cohnella terricola]|uniref:ABC transporter substrate-binding protein n=1 Tax=Cohnella terricola TaxID=1289167 RepID=A0A559J4I4_9BACL|nr:ABC transporter substrate-binding protein [Cohnella terricola]TVX94799.1 ABC transporter substrate-binding protein [Cohnella terricola]
MHKKLTKNLLFSVCLIGLLLVAACGTANKNVTNDNAAKNTSEPVQTSSPVKNEPAKAPTKIKVGTLKALADAPIYIALEKGYFKQQNLDVEDVAFETGAAMITPLTAGQIEVGGGGVSAGFYNALSRGYDIQIVADKGHVGSDSNYVAFLVRKELIDSGEIKDFKDLRGKKIAIVSATGSNAAHLSVALEKGGLTFDDIELIEMTFPNMGTAFGSGAIDVGIIPEPFVARYVENGLAVNWKGVNDVIPNAQTGVLFYSNKFAKEDPEAANHFMVAYLQGVQDYNNAFFKKEGYDEIVSILTKYTTVKEADLYEKMAPAGLNASGEINQESLELDFNWYKSRGLIEKEIDLSQVINSSFLEAAQKELGNK